MSRTLRVHPQYIQTVKSIWERKSDGRERVLAEELGLSLPQIHLFLKGQFVSGLDFLEICQAYIYPIVPILLGLQSLA
jgi:hypothetical protein